MVRVLEATASDVFRGSLCISVATLPHIYGDATDSTVEDLLYVIGAVFKFINNTIQFHYREYLCVC